MKCIFEEPEVPTTAPQKAAWTAIVPAAGIGSRLGHSRPKILYPIAGRSILAWLTALLEPRCARIVLVVSPAGHDAIADEARAHVAPGVVELVVQETPSGMGDAVARAKPAVSTRSALVVWGDQVTLRGATLDRLMSLHASRDRALLTLATVTRPAPYIHFARDDLGRITRVYQRRDEPIPFATGENDCGVFAFDAKALFATLEAHRAAAGELNLLPFFPEFERHPGAVATLRLGDERETVGVNTPEEAIFAGQILLERGRDDGL